MVCLAEVQETSARAPATRKLYSSKWGVFESWCLTRAIDPVNCPVGPVLEFLQERLTAGAAATTLRVYVAAIAARRELDEIPLGRHHMVSAFMRGARCLRPVRPTTVPSWDLSVVLEGLVTAPFEPLESASDRILTLKVVLLLALTSLKRVGDLQAFSVSETCMDFAPGLVKVLEGYPWRIFVLRQDGPLRTPLSGFYNLDVDTAPGSQVLSVCTDRMLLVHYWAR